jgi:tRNA pseudouridine55 synthase
MEAGKVLLLNKPYRWTSFDVVRKIRNKLKTKKIGHAGTLDPLATGLLILCVGTFTKRIEEFQAQEKEYTGTLVLGQTTESYDLETVPGLAVDISFITDEQIIAATKKFTGNFEQKPPLHSAIRINGKRAYDFARKGKEIELPLRPVEIKEFTIVEINKPNVKFKVVCSKGTYIRSLAHDVGQELRVGAYLSELCRTRIGEFKLEDALEVDEIENVVVTKANESL